ncbi:hypothetical protein QJ48_28320 [Paenibacillus sp. A3]|uniref:hypothetical protein n=1 Tax=Paenibacillus sp. A3 TaxID=1337054 RepID=UPI0006D5B5AF|nr:hypothetical protein [Paenibacillus sp. A3]KPV56344.1 hypothetical protein QJ48_28320 [Paenibacillus sp. A3]
MEKLTIEPGQGIGLIKLGMNKLAVEKALQDYTASYHGINYGDNYFADAFRIEYDLEEKVKFVEIPWTLKNVFTCTCSDIDVFNTKAEELIKKLDNISPYDRQHQELGYTYVFPQWGLSLWRSRKFEEDDMQTDWFKNLSPENQEDELRFMYFESVSIWSESYYT